VAWYNPTTWYETAATAVGSVYNAGQATTQYLFASNPQQASETEFGGGLGLFEPGFNQEIVDWDPAMPYTDRPGNQGCPPGYYTSYDSGGKVCRRYGYDGGKLVGYDATESERNAGSFIGNVTQSFAGITEALAAPIRTAVAAVHSVPWFKGSYVIIGILLAVALVLLMGSRFLSKAEGR
jgi:hypothetical protein